MASFVNRIFKAEIVRRKGIVRRHKSDVKYFGSFEELYEEVRQRGFHLIEIGEWYVVICSRNYVVHC